MEWLEGRGTPYELVAAGGARRVVLYDFAVPQGYNVPSLAANVRVEGGYPDTQIDMVYFYPQLARANGRPIAAISGDEFDGKVWQRWSRHRTPANPWRPGLDGLATHFALVQDWLERESKKP
jgi:hypothetical protein